MVKGFHRIGPPWTSNNQWQRMSIFAKADAIRTWRHDAHWQLYAGGVRPPEPLDRYVAKVTIIRVGPARLDRDNLWGGAKGMIDAMKAEPVVIKDAFTKKIIRKVMRPDGLPERCWGLYADDSDKFSDIELKQYITSDEARHGTFLRVKWRARA